MYILTLFEASQLYTSDHASDPCDLILKDFQEN